ARRPAVSEAVCLRVAFDMRAQFCNRAELHRSVRQLGLDRSVSIKRVGHAIDHAGFENCVALRLFQRCGLWPVYFRGHFLRRLCHAPAGTLRLKIRFRNVCRRGFPKPIRRQSSRAETPDAQASTGTRNQPARPSKLRPPRRPHDLLTKPPVRVAQLRTCAADASEDARRRWERASLPPRQQRSKARPSAIALWPRPRQVTDQSPRGRRPEAPVTLPVSAGRSVLEPAWHGLWVLKW